MTTKPALSKREDDPVNMSTLRARVAAEELKKATVRNLISPSATRHIYLELHPSRSRMLRMLPVKWNFADKMVPSFTSQQFR